MWTDEWDLARKRNKNKYREVKQKKESGGRESVGENSLTHDGA